MVKFLCIVLLIVGMQGCAWNHNEVTRVKAKSGTLKFKDFNVEMEDFQLINVDSTHPIIIKGKELSFDEQDVVKD